MKQSDKVILGSKSPRRIELLKNIIDDFIVEPSEYEEDMSDNVLYPTELVKKLAIGKAMDVAAKHDEECIVIGADTVVAVDNSVLGKPVDRADAIKMISMISGRSHEVCTGVCLVKIVPGQQDVVKSFAVSTKVNVAKMSYTEIERYIDKGESMDKAGAYAIQGYFCPYISGIEGDYCNVVGLPVARLYEELKCLD